MDAPRIAVVGMGRWGANYVRELGQRRMLAGVVDPFVSPEQVRVVAGVAAPVVPSVEALTRSVTFDGAVVCNPALNHEETAAALLRAGKHVLVEKPVALSVDGLLRLYEAADRLNLCLQSGHLLQHHTAVDSVRRLVREGSVGAVKALTSIRQSLGQVRRQEDVIWSFAPHDVSLMIDITGVAPDVVEVRSASIASGRADCAILSLGFGDRIGTIAVSWLAPIKLQLFTVYGEMGVISFNDTAPWADKLKALQFTLDESSAPDGSSIVPLSVTSVDMPLAETEPLTRQIEVFLEAIARGSRVLEVDRWLTIETTRVLEAATRGLLG